MNREINTEITSGVIGLMLTAVFFSPSKMSRG